MELHLDVVLLSTIKRKKPWPRFCWLGLEKESTFLLDDNRISEINMVSGRTKKKIPKLQPLLQRVVTMTASQNGMWLTGLLVSGEVFLWNKDRGCLKTINTALAVSQLVTAAHGTSVGLSLLVSGDGRRVLLTVLTGQVFLWECSDPQDLAGMRDGIVKGRWQQILPLENSALPSPQNKEASQHNVFIKGEAMGDCCLSAFTFIEGEELKVTFLKIQWEEGFESKLSSVGYSVHWVTQSYPLTKLSPPCRPLKSRGALIPAFSPDGQLLAITLNQRDPRASQVLFISTQNFVSVSSWLGGCSSKNLSIPSKYVRSYWVANVSWTHRGLYLACVLKRGSLLLLARLGGLISLSTSGCSVELGPAHFLPLHPLVTYRLPESLLPHDVSPTSSCASNQDVLRQRYSITCHPRLPYLIVSDGYMATVLRVPLHPSPTVLVSNLLLESVEGLERVRKGLVHIKPQMKMLLESMTTLKLSVSLQHQKKQEVALSTIPLFLQDDTDAREITELYARTQCTGEDDSEDESSQFPGTRVEDRGRLEFASMFDTLHAHPAHQLDEDPENSEDTQDSEEGALSLLVELDQVQRSLLTAWALGVSMGRVLEDRGCLLRCAVHCAVRLAGLLQLFPFPGTGNEERKYNPWASKILPFLRNMFSFLPWDTTCSGTTSCLGLAVELTRQIIHMILSPPPDSVKHQYPNLFSNSLSSALLILQLASHSLDLIYCLPKRDVFHVSDLKGEPVLHCSASDVFSVPFFQEGDMAGITQNALLTQQRPSCRLLEVWRVVYRQALQYQGEMLSQMSHANFTAELENISKILSQIQQMLQGAGDQLGGAPTLRSVAGEEHFLFGSYEDSAQVWRAELCAERERGGTMTCIVETRYCLALLYGHLFQYRLHEALGLCEHLARQLVRQTRVEVEDRAEPTEELEPLTVAWLPVNVGREAACAVVQSFSRFMAAYFTNQPLTILPPHCVEVLPPMHLPPAQGQRLVPLSQSMVLGEVHRQHLSEVWTVDYALDLLLQGGLLPEAVWLAHCLGDWKTAASLGLAYTIYCRNWFDFTRLKWRELYLPEQLQPSYVFQDQLEYLLGLEDGRLEDQSGTDNKLYKCFTDSMEEEDMELLQMSVQEILKASVMAEVDIISQPLHKLIEAAKDLASCLSGLVPPGLYLPAPPLYCPQPATDSQVSKEDAGLVSERVSRQSISGVLQRVLLLLRSAHCSLSAAQLYITNMQQCRQLLHKKCVQPLKDLPRGLLDFTSCGFFSSGNYREGHLDTVTSHVVACFRELCGLCWMLHVRDQLSVSCRKYQAARNQVRNSQGCDGVCYISGSDMEQYCMDTLMWACRLLPFSRFLKADEILQDLVLSLVFELPSIPLVIEILAQVFPEEEESVQVSLREKYSALLQRLRHCTLPASESAGLKDQEREEMVTVLMQEQLSQRRRKWHRIAKHLAPLRRHIWERLEEEEEEGTGANPMFDRFSLGASLSRSTLSDCGRSPVHSDGDRAATPSDTQGKSSFSNKQPREHCKSDTIKSSDKRDKSRHAESEVGWGSVKEPDHGSVESPAQPPIGTWEFELLDEEYPRFLELFLSYILGKGHAEGDDSALPLLSCFSPQLQERELHSLTFDVLTALKRRQTEQRDTVGRKHGASHRPAPQSPQPPPQVSSSTLNVSVQSEVKIRSGVASNVHLLPGLNMGKPQGLFGLRQHSWPVRSAQMQEVWAGTEASQSSTMWTPQSEYKALPAPDTLDLQQEMDPKLEAHFQDLSRLLEWMVRWADRRVLLGHPSRTRSNGTGVAVEGVVMRAKTSTPAILTALRVLERRYTPVLLGTVKHCPYVKVPVGQLVVAPVQPVRMKKLKRERSRMEKNTECPASAVTPIILPLHETPQGDVSEVSEVDEVEPEADLGRPLHENSQEGLTPDPENQAVGTQGGSLDEKIGFSPEPECESRLELAQEAEDSVSCISVQIKTLPRVSNSFQDQTLTLADLESEREESRGNVSQVVESGGEEPSLLTNESADLIAEVAVIPKRDESPGPGPVLEPDSESLPIHSVHANSASSAPQQGSTSDAQPTLSQSDPVRQLLPDDLFRLVQLQQLSFISLLQAFGGSLTNLPLAQLNMPLLNQTQQLVAPLRQPSQQAPAHPEQHNSGPATLSSELQPRAKKPDDQGPIHSDKHYYFNSCNENQGESNIDNITEDVHEFSDHPEESRGSQPESENFIPSICGLNTASPESTHFLPSFHQQVPILSPTGQSQESSSIFPPVTRLKLLQLQPPQTLLQPPPVCTSTTLLHSTAAPPLPREAWVQDMTSSATRRAEQTLPPLTISAGQDDPVTMRKAAEERKKPAGQLFTVPQRHTSHGQVTKTAWSLPKVPERPMEGKVGGVPLNLLLAPHSHSPPPPHGLPLLHFHHDPNPLSIVSHIPPAASTRPLIRKHNPSLQLLQRDPEPPSKGLPLTILPLNEPRLIPLDVLMGWEKRGPKDIAVPIIQHHFPTDDTQTGPADAAVSSSKRQKRRDEKRNMGKNTGVTFKLESSSVSPTEPERVELSGSTVEEAFVIPTGSISSMPETQDLAYRALSTAAELHAFASSQKRPPEVHDMSTNTEPVSSCSLIDKAISAKLPVCEPVSPETVYLQPEITAAPCPDVFLNLQFPSELPLQEHESTETAKQVMDEHGVGRHFINVISLEDEDLLQHLPSYQTSAPENNSPSHPTSIDLHLLAASVSNSTPPVLPVTGQMEEETMQGTQQESCAKSSPSAVHLTQALLEPVEDNETAGLLMDKEVCGPALRTWRRDENAVHRSPHYNSLPEIDTQEAVQQRINDHLDRDLANHKMPISIKEISGSSVELKDGEEQWYRQGVGMGETEEGFDTTIDRFGKERTGNLSNDNQGMSDMADTLEELLGVTGISTSLLSPSDTRIDRLIRFDEHERETRADRERQRLRAWMRKKQRERTAEYCRQREERREREHRPFVPSATKNLTSRDIYINKKIKEKKEKMLLQEHHTQRAHDACSLISELLSASPPRSTATTAPLSQSKGQSRRVSALQSSKSDGRKGRKAQFQTSGPSCLSFERTSEVLSRAVSRGNQTPASHLGLHRPANALPGDRLSQVTRRGMLTDLKGRGLGKDWKKGMGSPHLESSETGKTGLREEEEEVVSPWNPPLEIRRLLGLEEMRLGESLVDEGNESAGCGGGVQQKSLDSLSESTGSILSKLDWTAIEKLLAEEDDV
ncbi:hypothetical protein AGOR_G00012710 [Albula goreensis]|uniref:Ciliogenesis and planar polarity effector 1 n=1 Tax=Albula goreensis TaxID=1534307 RepID=A0A8T3E9X6_9TELE|nr:hypothetical protein AGOR_G00012710 [Albula goreensis]